MERIPFFIPYNEFLSWLNINFASLSLSDDIKLFSYIFVNAFFILLIIIFLKFVKGLFLFIYDKVF